MKKMIRQPTISTSQPPATGAAAPARAPTAAQVPMARPRASPLNSLPRMARLLGISRAAPTPWSPRPASSPVNEMAAPHNVDPRRKMAEPHQKQSPPPEMIPRDPRRARSMRRPGNRYALIGPGQTRRRSHGDLCPRRATRRLTTDPSMKPGSSPECWPRAFARGCREEIRACSWASGPRDEAQNVEPARRL